MKLSIPIFFANLVIPFVAIVDTGLMGNLENARYLVATSIAASVFSILFGSFGFLRSGTVGMIAHADGSNDYEEIINIFIRNISFVIIISFLLVVLQTYIYNISLSIFDINGRNLETLFSGSIAPGTKSIRWDSGQNSSGIYFVVLETEHYVDSKKLILVK